MRGPFPPIRHRKHRKYTKYSRCFLYCLDEKTLSQNCFAPQKVRFLCRTRRKAQEYWLCIPSIFNEVRREKILSRLSHPLAARPFFGRFFFSSAGGETFCRAETFFCRRCRERRACAGGIFKMCKKSLSREKVYDKITEIEHSFCVWGTSVRHGAAVLCLKDNTEGSCNQ